MIRLRISATGAALAVLLLIACRDAPTVPVAPPDTASAPSFDIDSLNEPPGPAQILEAYTDVDFYDGSHGGEPSMAIMTHTTYIGNRASMSTEYAIRGAFNETRNIFNTQDSFYNPLFEKRWTEWYYIPTGGFKCSLTMEARTQHVAWWNVWIRWFPNGESTRDIKFSYDDHKLHECDHPPHPDSTNGGDGGSYRGTITIETCYYWAHYVNGVLVDIELRYCTYDHVPVADE